MSTDDRAQEPAIPAADTPTTALTADDRRWLARCVELAAAARDAGDDPFGSVLVAGDGALVAEARNTVATDRDVTAHPELKLARLASCELTPDQRAAATMYTSGEHCPMCATAHAYAGIGRLVFALSAAQLAEATGRPGWGLPAADLLVRSGRNIEVVGPDPAFHDEVVALNLGG